MQTVEKNKMQISMKLLLSTTILLLTTTNILGQGSMGLSPQNDKKPSYNRLAIGLRGAHLYDLKFKPNKALNNGFVGEDMQGLKGEGTSFDMAFGFDIAYFCSPLFSLDLGYDMGKMTGSGEREYYKSDVSFLTLGANLDLKRAIRTKPYRFVPYARLALGRGTYDAERFFKEDNGSFTKASGACLQTAVGLGFRYHINDHIHLNLMSEFVANYTDEWDGFNYSSGNDHIVRTSFGVRYTFGKNKHVDRALAWQDRRVDQMTSTSNTETLDKALKALSDSLRIMNDKLVMVNNELRDKLAYDNADNDQDGVLNRNDVCPDKYGYARLGGCPDTTSTATTSQSGANALGRVSLNQVKKMLLIESNTISFPSGKATLDEDALDILNRNAVVLKNNPQMELTILGYTDNEGADELNHKLSKLRASAVRNYLIKRGVPAAPLVIKPMGKANPRDLRTNRRAKAQNRRVEFEVNIKG
jgi:outer membrane protein OmpA-like peptidoglycan-associated protein